MSGGNRFSFFRSYYDAAQMLTEPEERAASYDAICAYALDGVTPDFSGSMMGMFLLTKPILDESRAKAEAGAKGGSAKRETKQNMVKQSQAKESKAKQPEATSKQIEPDKEKEIGVGRMRRRKNRSPMGRQRDHDQRRT